MRPTLAAGVALTAAAAAAHLVPSIATVPALHRRVFPRLSGRSDLPHVALTFDDGPNPESTPQFLDMLDQVGVRATFFLLGAELAAHPALGRDIAGRGHELGVHGWSHTPHLLRTPWAVRADLVRAHACIRDTTGAVPTVWRPPNGILSGAGLLAARTLRLRPVLWTADGRDWRADATPASVLAGIEARLGPGGTVLLHDSDITSAPGSWASALGAVPDLVAACARRAWAVGPLRDHWN